MIDLGSIAGLHGHQHERACYGARCDRWVVLDLAAMIRDGYGERRLPLTLRCQVCGEAGRLQMGPPVPIRGPGGWMALRWFRTSARQGWLSWRRRFAANQAANAVLPRSQ